MGSSGINAEYMGSHTKKLVLPRDHNASYG